MGFFDSLVGWAMAPTNAGERPQEVPSPQQINRMDPTWQDLQSRSDGNPYQQVPMPPNIQQQIQAPDQGGGFPGGRPIPLPPTTGQVGQTQAVPQQQVPMLPGQSSATYKPGTDPDQSGPMITTNQDRFGAPVQQTFPPGRQDTSNVPLPPVRPGNLGDTGGPMLDQPPTTSQGADVSVGPRQGVPTPPTDLGQGLNLAQRLGISMDPERVERLKASLGAGLTAVGQKPGRLSAFAAGMGGALQGDVKEGDTQEERKLKAANQYFQQSSTAFQDMLRARAQNNQDAHVAAQNRWLDAKAEASKLVEGTGREAQNWRNSEGGRYYTANKQVDDRYKTELTSLNKLMSGGTLLPSAYETKKAELDKKREQWQQEAYTQQKLDPKKLESFKTRGIEAPALPDGKPNPKFNPFKYGQDYFSRAQFEAMVPPGGHYLLQKGEVYKSKDGKEHIANGTEVMIRNPPESDAPPQQQRPQQTSESDDDIEARRMATAPPATG